MRNRFSPRPTTWETPRPRATVWVAQPAIARAIPRTRTKRRVPTSPPPSPRPAMAADQLHETTLPECFFVETVLVPANAYQHLGVLRTQRHHQTPAELQLIEQRPRYLRRCRGHQDRVVGRMLGPSDRSITDLDEHVVVAERFEPAAR